MKSRKRWPENLVEAICEVIAEQRKERGLSVYALAQLSGVSQQAIGYYEKKQRRPSVECLARVARGLGLELSELIEEAEKRVG